MLSFFLLHFGFSLQQSSNTFVPNTEVPRVDMLAFTGKAVQGDVLTAVQVIPKTEIQQLVWSKYKGAIEYQWYIASLLSFYPWLNIYTRHLGVTGTMKFSDPEFYKLNMFQIWLPLMPVFSCVELHYLISVATLLSFWQLASRLV